MTSASFLFTVCQVGAEPVLKKEIARDYPELRFAYSRPGFVTFKKDGKKEGASLGPDFKLESVFARAYGVSIGKVRESFQACLDEVLRQARTLRETFSASGPLVLHVWERDRFPPGEEPPGFSYLEFSQKIVEALRPTGEFDLGAPSSGALVLDVVVLEENEWWLGYHFHSDAHSPLPGGRFTRALPAEAPSRAWLKLEEVIDWAGLPIRAGDVAVEIGSAPGGACYSLLKRGVSVAGIDPGDMSEAVLSFGRRIEPKRGGAPMRARPSVGVAGASPWFQHIRKSVAEVSRSELPADVHWLLLDMNVVPNLSMAAIGRLIPEVKSGLLGVALTIKLNRWILAEDIPALREKVSKMGLLRVRAAQLSTHKQEIVIVGLTRQGLARVLNPPV